MSRILKILKGPNAGAQIALAENVAITIGKSDSCDIVLADESLPAKPIKLVSTSAGVEMDGAKIELLTVVEIGSSAFAVAGAKDSWSKLKWPKKESEIAPEKAPEEKKPAAQAKQAREDEAKGAPEAKPKKRHWFVCTLAILFLLALAVFGFCKLFPDKAALCSEKISPYCEKVRPYGEKCAAIFNRACAWTKEKCSRQEVCDSANPAREATIEELVELYDLARIENAGREILRGDFTTRAGRLAATAEIYALQPGANLDFADEESLKTALVDTLALVGEQSLKVERLEKRCAYLSGAAKDIDFALSAIRSDLPKLEDIDIANVTRIAAAPAEAKEEAPLVLPETPVETQVRAEAPPREPKITLPVCGIFVSPYPCLVLRNGSRIMEGAAIGDYVVLKIEADSVILSNSAGRVVWKP